MTVVLVDPRRPSLVPVEAIDPLTGDVQYTEEMPVKVPWSLPAARPAYEGDDAPVLLSSDRDHPAVKARLEAGDKLIAAPDAAPGERLVDAVAMMDKLRTSGPWEGEQTHDSLRRYLLEETYEVFDAVRGGDADELREELGDVLLQVLFHARIAEDAPQHPFTIDDAAASRRWPRRPRSHSRTSRPRWCASPAAGSPPCSPVSRSLWTSSLRSGRS